MKRVHRGAAAVLLTLQLAGCGYWQVQPGDVRDVLADPEIRHVRLTESNGQQVEARLAEIRGDTLYGTRGGSTPISCEQAAATCTLQMPISRVGLVESRKFSAVKTAALFVVPVGGLVILLFGDRSCPEGVVSGC